MEEDHVACAPVVVAEGQPRLVQDAPVQLGVVPLRGAREAHGLGARPHPHEDLVDDLLPPPRLARSSVVVVSPLVQQDEGGRFGSLALDSRDVAAVDPPELRHARGQALLVVEGADGQAEGLEAGEGVQGGEQRGVVVRLVRVQVGVAGEVEAAEGREGGEGLELEGGDAPTAQVQLRGLALRGF